jgi:uncharacterized protein with gpF-like domain
VPKDIVLAPIYPNAGLEAAYRKRLLKLVDEMSKSLLWWLRAAYREHEPTILAEDASPSHAMSKAMEDLAKRWTKRFDAGADEFASYFAKASAERTDAAMKAALRKAGFTIKFKPTKAQTDLIDATTKANVALIKSIPQQYLTNVQGLVFRAIQTGGDLGTLTKELQTQHGVTRRRASFIARDQSNKATAALKRARQTELGIEEEAWRHSGGGKHPRPSHVKAGKDRVRYRVDTGWLDPATGRRIWPGTEAGCRCVGRSIIPGLR